jgi:hypothetical protein
MQRSGVTHLVLFKRSEVYSAIEVDLDLVVEANLNARLFRWAEESR